MDALNPEHVRVLNLEPGDVVVLTVPSRLSAEDAHRLRAQIQERFPGHEALVLEAGMEMSVAREVFKMPGVAFRRTGQIGIEVSPLDAQGNATGPWEEWIPPTKRTSGQPAVNVFPGKAGDPPFVTGG